jgi:hypothetical protein
MNKSSLTLLAALLACGPSASPVVEPVAPQAEPVPEPISEKEMRDHVQVLAGDDYLGRGTLEQGEQRAAAYLSAHFAKLGLEPLPGQSDFKVPFKLTRSGFDVDHTKMQLSLGGTGLDVWVPGRDFKPFYFSDDGNYSGEIVFAGYGITAPELGWDDYAGLDVKGKLVFVLRHSPGPEQDKNWAGSRHAFFLSKARAAQKAGAVGMILVTDPRHSDQADDLRMTGHLTVPSREGGGVIEGIRWISDLAQAATAAKGKTDDKLVAIHVSPAAGEKIATSFGKSLAQLQKAIDSGTKPKDVVVRSSASATVQVKRQAKREEVFGTNVAGFLRGSEKPNEWIVVGAHYDHLGAFDGQGDTVYNGADDNASGTAAVLAMASRMAKSATRPKRSIVFVGFSAEEKGLLGSRAMLAQAHLPRARIAFMVNLDMIGRNPERPVSITGDGFAAGLADIVTRTNEGLGLKIALGGTNISANSDHWPFFSEYVPVINFFTGLHRDYHQLSDHPDKLEYSRMVKITTLAAKVTEELAKGDALPRFVHRPFWLGAAIEVRRFGAAYKALVTEVEAESPAQRSGFAVGDIITAVSGVAVEEPDEVGTLLDDVEPGTKTEVKVARHGSEMEIEVVRAKRGYLGVFPRSLNPLERKSLGIPETMGVVIAGLTDDGPAAKAGIKKDDVLIEIRGLPVNSATLRLRLARIGAGEKVNITVIRAGKRLNLELVLGERPKR